jgi:hypothetical protein
VIVHDCPYSKHYINTSLVMFWCACAAASSGPALSLSSSASDLVEFSSVSVPDIEASGRAGLLGSSEPCVVLHQCSDTVGSAYMRRNMDTVRQQGRQAKVKRAQ